MGWASNKSQKAKCGRGYEYVVGQRGTCIESPVPGHIEYCAKRHPSPIAELTKQVEQLLDPDDILNPGAVI
jgi:hypothetical protein